MQALMRGRCLYHKKLAKDQYLEYTKFIATNKKIKITQQKKKFRNKKHTEQKNYYVNQYMNLINNWGHRNYRGKKLCPPAW